MNNELRAKLKGLYVSLVVKEGQQLNIENDVIKESSVVKMNLLEAKDLIEANVCSLLQEKNNVSLYFDNLKDLGNKYLTPKEIELSEVLKENSDLKFQLEVLNNKVQELEGQLEKSKSNKKVGESNGK